MRSILKHLVLPGLAALLLASSLGASAAGSQPSGAALASDIMHSAATQACDKLQAGPVSWVVLDEQGEIERQVTEYPSGTTEIVPTFEYSCVPKHTTIVTVFTYAGEAVLSDKQTLRPSAQASVYAYPLSTEDSSPLEEGEWKVAFYQDKVLLASGAVRVGGAPRSSRVTVRGTVRDGNTRKPIKGALVAVLKPGISVKTFLDTGKESDVFTSGTTDSLGQFSLSRPLARGTTYGLLIVARGYRPITRDDLRLGVSDADPLSMDILMVK
ncbi:MAG TPA: carboxypeptidase-like regulatory domain-containing protein [Roseiflexaceae bacterium]|nr:carboxypeptidase-like regulatory domain-containing protein [Roseiflexaceae bacterium]